MASNPLEMPNLNQPPIVQTAVPKTPAPAATPPPADHGMFYHVLEAIGGGKQRTYTADDQGKVIPHDSDPSPGQLGKHILAAALTGMFAGSQQRGQGSAGRALGAGAEAQMGADSAADAVKQKQAENDFKNGQETQLRKAQIFQANAGAAHTMRLAEQVQGETFTNMVDRDSSAFGEVDPADVVDKGQPAGPGATGFGVPQDQALANLKAGKYGATEHNVYVTGYTEAKDKDGNVIKDPQTGEPKMEALVSVTNDNAVPLKASDAARYIAAGVRGVPPNPADGTTVRQSVKRGWDQQVHAYENVKGLSKQVTGGTEAFDEAAKDPHAPKAFQDFARWATGKPASDLEKMATAKNKDGSPVYPTSEIAVLRDALGGDKAQAYEENIKNKELAEQEKIKGTQKLADEKAAVPLQEAKEDRNAQRAEARQSAKDTRKDAQTWGRALDPQTNEMVHMTKAEADAKGLQGFEEMKGPEIQKEKQMVRQMGDVQLNTSRYAKAAQDAIKNPPSAQDYAMMHQILNKAGAAEFDAAISQGGHIKLPIITAFGEGLDREMNSEDYRALSPQAKALIDGHMRTVSSVPAFIKALTGSGRFTEQQLDLELANLGNPTMAPQDIARKLQQWQENIDQGASGLTKYQGIPSTKEIRQSIEGLGAVKVGGQNIPLSPDGTFQMHGHIYKVNPDGRGGTLVK